ncbi:DNA polymerase III subunit delta' [Halanaerobium salsuginis]|jgi:DNA polymerase-3 subunit delta'|uniref:DNA polymerase III subunit delta' n=1 Tax=Halanaerobium salsuginis TaxID=29563 RepID=A0A1I4J887_9FIRM|nr:DNA polymerase III subunit delta' [Halanaerobium salsuginis]SFL62760.1 DNA polymerase III, delta prime subunit [Halanaerobium salsuginis]
MSFSSIIGQAEAIDVLSEEIRQNRISHAYLFSGKSGIGKGKLAFEFAKAIFCQESPADSCGHCLNCRKMDHQNHPDFKRIAIADEKNSISITQIRDLKKEIAYKPYESAHKVYLIESAEEMTAEAANSLLKTLEEPPSFATIILLAEDTSRLLPTIISRCQQLSLQPVTRSQIKDILLEHGLQPEEAEILSQTAGGSPGQALKLAEIDDYFSVRKKVYDFVKNIKSKNTIEIFKFRDYLVSLISAGFPCFDLLSDWYRDIIMIKQNYQATLKNKDYLQDMNRLAGEANQEQLIKNLDLIEKSELYIKKNIKAELSLEVLLFKLRQADQE